MSEEIIKVLDAVCDKIGIAVDWSAENITPQIVDVITRYGHYLLADAIVGFVLGIVMIVIAILCAKKAIYIAVKSDSDDDSIWYNYDGLTAIVGCVLLIAVIMCSVFGIIFIFVNISTIIKCATIPDIYAAEQIIKMLQNGG